MVRVRRATGCITVTAALMGAGLALLAAPAGAVTVSTEAELQTAFEDPAETSVVLANSIDLTCAGGAQLARNSATALALDGNGFTIRQTCAGFGVISQLGAGALTLDDVTITGGNTAAAGGGIESFGPLTLTSSTVAGNQAGPGGGIQALAGVTVVRSTISGNTADPTSAGGGINSGGPVTVINSTITGNSDGLGVGGINVVPTGETITLGYATVVGNSGTNLNMGGGGTLVSFGSVVALAGGVNCGLSTTTSNGYNFSDDDTCNFTGTGDRQSAGDPLLGALAGNGGPTQTRLPLTASPLLDAIPVAACPFNGITTDQRGVTRPQGTGCDVGSVEVAAATAAPPPGATPPAAPVGGQARFTG